MKDPTEIALECYARKAHVNREEYSCSANRFSRLCKQLKFISELPFDSILKRMTVVYMREKGGVKQLTYLAKGAVESILGKSSFVLDESGTVEELTNGITVNVYLTIATERKDRIVAQMLAFSSKGMRVLALAYKINDVDARQGESAEMFIERLKHENRYEERDFVESGFVFIGLAAIYDPPRKSSREAVEICHEAGIEVHMATGDHPSTAVSIALEIGILPSDLKMTVQEILKRRDLAITAAEFEKLSEEEIDRLPSLPRVLARCSPESKVKLIGALHRRGKFVVMTGDGVNDAPAVKQADIGIAMGMGGSDVTKVLILLLY